MMANTRLKSRVDRLEAASGLRSPLPATIVFLEPGQRVEDHLPSDYDPRSPIVTVRWADG